VQSGDISEVSKKDVMKGDIKIMRRLILLILVGVLAVGGGDYGNFVEAVGEFPT